MTSQDEKNENPALRSNDAPTAEDTSRATQQNQDANRPDQQQKIQRKQNDVVNDNSDPRYAMTDTEEKELPEKEYENQEDRTDDLKHN